MSRVRGDVNSGEGIRLVRANIRNNLGRPAWSVKDRIIIIAGESILVEDTVAIVSPLVDEDFARLAVHLLVALRFQGDHAIRRQMNVLAHLTTLAFTFCLV